MGSKKRDGGGVARTDSFRPAQPASSARFPRLFASFPSRPIAPIQPSSFFLNSRPLSLIAGPLLAFEQTPPPHRTKPTKQPCPNEAINAEAAAEVEDVANIEEGEVVEVCL